MEEMDLSVKQESLSTAVEGDSWKEETVCPKIQAGTTIRGLGGRFIPGPNIEIAVANDRFLGLYFSDILWHYLAFGHFRDYFL
jgi:hypothetical protein